MPDLGISVLLKGQNFMRMLAGLGVALKISLISVVISIPLGIVLGVLMTWKNPITKAILRIYLEIVRIMPQWYCYFSYFRDNASVWLGLIRRKCINYSIYILGSS